MHLQSARSSSRVAFLTFSRSAVSQIESRARGLLAGVRDRIEVQTFHSLAYRIIRGFGRYAGAGITDIGIQSEARRKLLGADDGLLTYDDLVPIAVSILERSTRVRELFQSRWPLVICDEVQDTNEEQWNLLQLVNGGRMLLLGDPNQLIFTFVKGVSQERFETIRASADRVVELEERSHRDPTGVIPALAKAVRVRQFDHPAVPHALDNGQLRIVRYAEGSGADELIQAINDARAAGARSVSVFGHSNASVSEIAEVLTDSGIEHVLVGIPEAHAEALAAMVTMCQRSLGLATSEETRTSLAIFLTSTWRGNTPPALAEALIGRSALPERLELALASLDDALVDVADRTVRELSQLVATSWLNLPIQRGRSAWLRAGEHFLRLTRTIADEEISDDSVAQLGAMVEESRVAALVNLDMSERGTISLMNFHQTKGREADAVIHLYREDDYFGSEGPPYENNSRLLNVSISRARRTVTILLPPRPHPLVAPFASL